MKKIGKAAFLFVLFSVSGCTLVEDDSSFPNGIEIDKATKSKLLFLEQEFYDLVETKISQSRELGENGAQAEPSDPPFIQAAKEILVREFGAAGLDYIIINKIGEETINVSEPESEQPGLASMSFTYNIGEDVNYSWYMNCEAKWASLPWGAFNWGETTTRRVVKVDGYSSLWRSGSMKTVVRDEVTPSPGNSTLQAAVSSQTTNGNIKVGFFPPTHPANLVTVHSAWDGVFTNGFATKTLSWAN